MCVQTTVPSKYVLNKNNNIIELKHVRKINLWKSGFTVDDGPLRLYTDLQHAQFIHSINRGKIPNEFEREANERKVIIYKNYHTNEDPII